MNKDTNDVVSVPKKEVVKKEVIEEPKSEVIEESNTNKNRSKSKPNQK